MSSQGALTYEMRGRDSVTLLCSDIHNSIVKISVTQISCLAGSLELGNLFFSEGVTKRPRNSGYASEFK